MDLQYLNYLEPFPYDPNLPMPTMDSVAQVYTPNKQYHRKSASQVVRDWPAGLQVEKVMCLIFYFLTEIFDDVFIYKLTSAIVPPVISAKVGDFSVPSKALSAHMLFCIGYNWSNSGYSVMSHATD